MYENIKYSTNGKEYIINGDAPDLIGDLAHKVLFSIENDRDKKTFSYNIGISHQLWDYHWKVHPNSESQMVIIKEIYIEKVKRLLDAGKEEYLDVTLTQVNTPKDVQDALESLKKY